MSSAFLCVRKHAEANISYVDLDPDVTLDNDGEEFYLDINGDLLNDILFANQSHYNPGYYSSGGSYVLPDATQKIWARPFDHVSVAGMQHLSYSFSFRYWPYAMEFNRQIDNSLQFQSDWSQLMFYRSAFFPSGGPESIGGSWIPDIIDHYLGIRILGNDDHLHYGWIRCDVKDEGKTVIIKDYALQMVPDYFIITGDTVDEVSAVSSHNSITADVFYTNQSIQVAMDDFIDCRFILFDLSGQAILQKELSQKNETIPVHQIPAGNYLVVISNGSKQYIKKLFIF